MALRLLILAALTLAACGDDDRVNPSTPDASPAKDAGLESGKDGAHDAPEDVRSEGHHDAEADSGENHGDGGADALAE